MCCYKWDTNLISSHVNGYTQRIKQLSKKHQNHFRHTDPAVNSSLISWPHSRQEQQSLSLLSTFAETRISSWWKLWFLLFKVTLNHSSDSNLLHSRQMSQIYIWMSGWHLQSIETLADTEQLLPHVRSLCFYRNKYRNTYFSHQMLKDSLW